MNEFLTFYSLFETCSLKNVENIIYYGAFWHYVIEIYLAVHIMQSWLNPTFKMLISVMFIHISEENFKVMNIL